MDIENVIKEDKEYKQLEEINKDLDNVEKKLKALPSVEVDNKKYNRKQRRQIQRRMMHEEKTKTKQIDQKGNTFVTRREFVGLFQSLQRVRDRLFYVDVLSGVIEKLLIQKNIITREELTEHIKIEQEKALAFQEIQKGEKDYENRLKKCIELEVDPNISVIGQQIYQDPELSLADKRKLAEEYKLEALLKVLSQIGENKD